MPDREQEHVKHKRHCLISACLLGVRCRYDGQSARADRLCDLTDQWDLVPVCPEQLGGLPTPRESATLRGGDGLDVLDGKARVIAESGEDVTAQFIRGAEETLRIALALGIHNAFMKENSPSCGVLHVYRETGLGRGTGVTTALLMRHGIEVSSV